MIELCYEKDNVWLYQGDNVEFMKTVPNDVFNLTVTSPPYDNLRSYKGYSFDFENLAKELYRTTKEGGTVVWIVGDETVKGSETGSSFKQALYFKEIGFNLHDTMIWNKGSFSAVGSLKTRYAPVFEYMFILTKGKIKTFNPIKDKPNVWAGTKNHGTVRIDNDVRVPTTSNVTIGEFGQRHNIWLNPPHRQQGDGKHPAPFPEDLINDHVLSWSNEGDLVFDPFNGSGTTAKMAKLLNRKFVGIDISKEYVEMQIKRINSI